MIQNPLTSTCLMANARGQDILLLPCESGNSRQLWTVGNRQIRSQHDPDACFDRVDERVTPGTTRPKLWTCNSSNSQIFDYDGDVISSDGYVLDIYDPKEPRPTFWKRNSTPFQTFQLMSPRVPPPPPVRTGPPVRTISGPTSVTVPAFIPRDFVKMSSLPISTSPPRRLPPIPSSRPAIPSSRPAIPSSRPATPSSNPPAPKSPTPPVSAPPALRKRPTSAPKKKVSFDLPEPNHYGSLARKTEILPPDMQHMPPKFILHPSQRAASQPSQYSAVTPALTMPDSQYSAVQPALTLTPPTWRQARPTSEYGNYTPTSAYGNHHY